MAATFSLALYPWVYLARFQESGQWSIEFREQEHGTPQEEAQMTDQDRSDLLARRNQLEGLPLVNYTSQYGMGCFEGLKAFPQPDGSLRIFRPDKNGERMKRSMEGLRMPGFPVDLFVYAVTGVTRRNQQLGFSPVYDAAWETNNFVTAQSIYMRPFSYTEPGIGLNLSTNPWVVVISTPVGSYFDPDSSNRAITSDKARATRGGTGWIKCDANYVIPTLVKFEAQAQGYMEAVFLDAETKTFVEEGSSSNIFFLMKNGSLVTPSLEDTILPGITRESVLTLAQDRGIKTEERKVSIEEVLSEATEAFVSGTAAGMSYLESITHKGTEAVFNNRKMGDLTRDLLHELKGIQYGAVEDRHDWMVTV